MASSDVAVIVGMRALLATALARIASLCYSITVEFAVVFNQADYIVRELLADI